MALRMLSVKGRHRHKYMSIFYHRCQIYKKPARILARAGAVGGSDDESSTLLIRATAMIKSQEGVQEI